MSFEMLIVTTDKQLSVTLFLSLREKQVLQLSAEGLSNKQIADQLNISDDTIDTHNRNIAAKLGAKNMKNAIALGIRRGIIE